MNKRQRIKRNKVQDKELWDFYYTIAEWIVPRLKRFKKINIAYPGRSPMDTPEKWDAALDQMIEAFEMAKQDPVDLYGDYIATDFEKYKELSKQWYDKVEVGLKLFAEYYFDLWI